MYRRRIRPCESLVLTPSNAQDDSREINGDPECRFTVSASLIVARQTRTWKVKDCIEERIANDRVNKTKALAKPG